VRAEVSLDPNKLMAELNRSSTRCLIWIWICSPWIWTCLPWIRTCSPCVALVGAEADISDEMTAQL
jgi:hypothetical protein